MYILGKKKLVNNSSGTGWVMKWMNSMYDLIEIWSGKNFDPY